MTLALLITAAMGSHDTRQARPTFGSGNVYAAPYNSDTILAVDTATDTVTLIDSTQTGARKWSGIAMAPGGKVCAAPFNNDNILVLDPATNTVSLIKSEQTGDSKWSGIAVGHALLYAAPFNNDNVLVINPALNSVSHIPTGQTGAGKWSGIATGTNGKLYGAPYNSDSVLVVDPATASVSLLALPQHLMLQGGSKWNGIASDRSRGLLFAAPASNDNVLVIHTVGGDAVSVIPSTQTGPHKWNGIAYAADAKFYCAPSGNPNILVINTQYTAVGNGPFPVSLLGQQGGSDKFDGIAALPAGAGGRLYAAPRSSAALVVDTKPGLASTVSLLDSTATGADLWAGIVADPGSAGTQPYNGCWNLQCTMSYLPTGVYCYNKDTDACEAVQESECLPKAQNGQGPDREWCARKSFSGCVGPSLCQSSGVVTDKNHNCWEETHPSSYLPVLWICSSKSKTECTGGGKDHNTWCDTFSGCDPVRPEVCMLGGKDMPSSNRCYDAASRVCWNKSEQQCAAQNMVYCGVPVTPVPVTPAPVTPAPVTPAPIPVPVTPQTKGDACGCPAYRNGAAPTDHVLCKVYWAWWGGWSIPWCEPPDSHGQCPVSKSWACGQKTRMSLLVVSALSDLLNNNFLEILAKGLKTAVTNLIMEWICPAEVCTPECPTTKEWKVIRGCRNALKTPGRIGEVLSRGKWVVQFTTPVEMAEGETVTIARGIDTLVGDIQKGKPVSPEEAAVKPYILPDSELRVGAAPETDNPFDEAGPPEIPVPVTPPIPVPVTPPIPGTVPASQGSSALSPSALWGAKPPSGTVPATDLGPTVPPPSKGDGGSSIGMILGIVFGILAALGLVAGAAVVASRKNAAQFSGAPSINAPAPMYHPYHPASKIGQGQMYYNYYY